MENLKKKIVQSRQELFDPLQVRMMQYEFIITLHL